MKHIMNCNWLKYKNNEIKYNNSEDELIIINESGKHGFLINQSLYSLNHDVKISFKGEVIEGTSAILYLMDLKKNIIAEVSMNSDAYISILNKKKYLLAIKILPRTSVKLSDIVLEELNDKESIINELNSDVLVITPSYPSLENKYLCGFVHSRLKLYKENGINFDLIVAHDYKGTSKYNYEGIDVFKMNFFTLRNILQTKKYKKILVHFFDYKYSNIFDACDLSETQLYLWVHGPETLYWDWPKFTTEYFKKYNPITFEQNKLFQQNDKLIKRYNNMPNVKWIFVSNWIKEQSERLIGLKFNNYEVIPNIIDEVNFNYVKKDSEQRKKIFFVRRFDDCNKYAIDVAVRTIVELSRREIFNNLEFNIYGTGNVYDKLISPIKEFNNVNLYPKFLSHEEISNVHKENGIALFPTRYDAQGVSLCEAALSGLAVVTSTNDAVKEFLPSDLDIYANTEDYKEYADIIERMYYDEQEFQEVSKRCHQSILDKCSFKETVLKEINMIRNDKLVVRNNKLTLNDKPILSIIIPSYNVSKYLRKGINSIFEHKNAEKIEVIIVNDGSKDNTLSVAKELQKKYCNSKKQNIKIIDKENGGHGSTINEGLKVVTGKYTRIMDGDDWLESNELCKLIDILEVENSDIVMTDYSEDRADINEVIKKEIYSFMLPGKQYIFDDLCYEGYGFNEWGPILATSNFKTIKLKDMKYKLSEKSFYVDMEFNFFSIINAQTITYYDLDIYRYFIGRIDQSISRQSYIKNYEHHQRVLFRIISILEKESNVSIMKRQYVIKKIIIPMITANYTIVCDFMRSMSAFNKFDRELKKYNYLYQDDAIVTRYIKFQRITKGLFLKFDIIIRRIYNMLKG